MRFFVCSKFLSRFRLVNKKEGEEEVTFGERIPLTSPVPYILQRFVVITLNLFNEILNLPGFK